MLNVLFNLFILQNSEFRAQTAHRTPHTRHSYIRTDISQMHIEQTNFSFASRAVWPTIVSSHFSLSHRTFCASSRCAALHSQFILHITAHSMYRTVLVHLTAHRNVIAGEFAKAHSSSIVCWIVCLFLAVVGIVFNLFFFISQSKLSVKISKSTNFPMATKGFHCFCFVNTCRAHIAVCLCLPIDMHGIVIDTQDTLWSPSDQSIRFIYEFKLSNVKRNKMSNENINFQEAPINWYDDDGSSTLPDRQTGWRHEQRFVSEFYFEWKNRLNPGRWMETSLHSFSIESSVAEWNLFEPNNPLDGGWCVLFHVFLVLQIQFYSRSENPGFRLRWKGQFQFKLFISIEYMIQNEIPLTFESFATFRARWIVAEDARGEEERETQ